MDSTRPFLIAVIAAACLASSVVSRGDESTKAASPSEVSDRITALDLALARIVSEQPNLWRLDALEDEAAALLLEAEDPAQRAAVRDVASRIDRFAAIGQRYRDSRGVTRSGEASAPRRTLRRTETAAVASTRGEYDAVGILRPVVSKRPDAPKYALVDADGKVKTLVTPSTDVDLEPLLGKRIGVRGRRGFVPEYRRDYVTASRATALDTIRR